MHNAIIGTAGHVDHGKTSLIRALTGIDTDRLKEEKRRGITIELGFAYLTLPNMEKVGIIDVPGHEKFIRNMLTGAGSMDLAIMVIAADEGFMPQTREHLAILSMLGIKRGLIALTKADAVEPDWLEMVILDIEDEIAGTFLQNCQIIPVSAHTGFGMDALKRHLFNMLAESRQKPRHAPARMPIDRVFSMDGFGTVITGTLIEGELRVGDDIVLYPTEKTGKIRRLQIHGEQVEAAPPGSRVAANISGIRIADAGKGDVLAAGGSLENSDILHVRLDIQPDAGREIANNSRLHLHHGSRELLCRVNLLNKPLLTPGESGYAQLILESPLAAKPGDPFVVRFYSPLETIGGGIILDPIAKKLSRKDTSGLENLQILDTGNFSERIAIFVKIHSKNIPRKAWIHRVLFSENPDFDIEIAGLIKSEIIYQIADRLVHMEYIDNIGKLSQKILISFHNTNPFMQGIQKSELRSRLLPNAEQVIADSILDLLVKKSFICISDNFVAHKNFTIKMDANQQKFFDDILTMYLAEGLTPTATDEIAAKFKERRLFTQGHKMLCDQGKLVALDSQICLHIDQFDNAKQAFVELAKANSEITLAQFRDKLGISRKYALAILEYFDKKGISKKIGDQRTCLILGGE